jgi:hypothetical protein
MSAFGGKADMTYCGNPLLLSLLGVKRTSLIALHMSANDGGLNRSTQHSILKGKGVSGDASRIFSRLHGGREN